MLITSLLGFAQSREAGKYLASYLNMATGMPNNYADDIFKDSYGFVWISTHGGGLVRYDGYQMTSLGYTASPIALHSNSTRNVCEDRFRRLWIALRKVRRCLALRQCAQSFPNVLTKKWRNRWKTYGTTLASAHIATRRDVYG